MKGEKKQLWGQEFNVVKAGLDEEQVNRFVTDLMSKYKALAQQQEPSLALGVIFEKTAKEANKAAEEIKAMAMREAEAEAASIIAKANQRAREMMAEGKKAAQEMTQKEVESILLAANRKAAIIETEAKQRAQLYLIRSRESIEGELRDETKKAYNRMLSSLQDLLAEGHDVEAEWMGKTTELRKREAFELEGYEVPSAFATEIARTPPLVAAEAEIGIPEKEEEVVSEVPTAEAVAPEEVEAVAPEEVKPTFVPPELRPPGTYEGEIELVLTPPIDLAVMSEIHSQLQTIPEVKILRTVGSWDKGTTITLLLEKPLPLVDMLTKIPAVEVTSELPERQGLLKKTINALGAKGRERVRNRIALKTKH